MELLVAKDKENDMWVVHVGKTKNSSPIPLVPASENLYRVVLAIMHTYPSSRVFIDPAVTNNPFVYQMLSADRVYGLAPDPGLVQRAIENDEVKTCDFCQSPAYYNPHKRLWVCLHCGAEECYVDGKFIKVRRWR